MAPLYRPPTRVVTVDRPYLALVSQADPDFQRKKHREVEYATSRGRPFYADPMTRGAYNQHDNTYPVGQPYGANDPAYEQRPFYSGIPTGSWA